MKEYKSILIKGIMMLVLLCGSLSAAAQWAGPDQEVLRTENNDQTITLSVLNAQPNACYIWTGENIQGDNKQPTVTANPQSSVCTYVCKCISALGVDEDEVVVTLDDSVAIVSVTPIKECYADGDPIVTSNFTIVTNPAGYENQVTVSPIRATSTYGQRQQELTFSLTVEGKTATKTANIDVISSEQRVSLSESRSVKELYKILKSGGEVVKKAMDAKEAMKAMDKLRVTPCSPTWDFTFDPQFPFECTQVCCNDKTTEVLQVNFPAVTLSGGIDCTVPIWGFPYAASVNLVLSVGASVTAGPASGQMAWQSDCFEAKLPISFSFSASGGLGVSVLSPDVLSIDARLQSSISKSLEWVIGKSIQWDKTKLSLDVVGTVKTIGLFTESITFNVGYVYL